MTAFIRDNETTTFTLIGERSCDSFKFCIAGKNIAGQGVFSCNPDTLLYILPLERISHTLFQSERNFLLSVNVTVSYSTKKIIISSLSFLIFLPFMCSIIHLSTILLFSFLPSYPLLTISFISYLSSFCIPSSYLFSSYISSFFLSFY